MLSLGVCSPCLFTMVYIGKHWTERKINLSSNKSIGTKSVEKIENSLLIEMIIWVSVICRSIKMSIPNTKVPHCSQLYLPINLKRVEFWNWLLDFKYI